VKKTPQKLAVEDKIRNFSLTTWTHNEEIPVISSSRKFNAFYKISDALSDQL